MSKKVVLYDAEGKQLDLRAKGVVPSPAVSAAMLLILLAGFSCCAAAFYVELHQPDKKPNSTPITSLVPVPNLNRPPSVLNINGQTWQVEENTVLRKDLKADGLTLCDDNVILYSSESLNSYSLVRSTMWHEVQHALLCQKDTMEWTARCGKLPSSPEQHATVCRLGMALPGFIQDNKDFIDWTDGRVR